MRRAPLALAISLLLAGCSSQQSQPPAAANEANSAASAGSVERLDPQLNALVPESAKIEKLAGGFQFIEGPLYFPAGYLWFSDVVGNVVRQWSPDGKVTE